LITCKIQPLLRTLAAGVVLAAMFPPGAFAYVVAPGTQSNKVHLEIYDPDAQAQELSVFAKVVAQPAWMEGVTCVVTHATLTEVTVAFDVMPSATVGTSGQLVVSIEASTAAGQPIDVVRHQVVLDVVAEAPGEQHSFEIPECCVWGADVDVEEYSPGRPVRHVLLGNSPNPFKPLTSVRFGLPGTGGMATLRVHDVGGRTIRTIITPMLGPGYHQITWNGKNDAGRFVSPGVYFYDLTSGDWSASSKMLLLR
jgi:hypothetical protein